jgi:hypothetical protein
MRIRNNRVLAVAAGAGILVASSSVGAVAAKLVTSEDIKNGTIQSQDIGKGEIQKADIASDSVGASEIIPGSVGLKSLSDQAEADLASKITTGAQGPKGPKGDVGPAGRDGLSGAVYRVLTYKNGGGGDATVACADTNEESMKYTAIAGGVEAGHAQAGYEVPPNDFAVTASFPGRMDWNTGKPKAGRLDGWIVLGNGKYTDNLRVWALCVPNDSIEVQADELVN